jgi:hypothetical protein
LKPFHHFALLLRQYLRFNLINSELASNGLSGIPVVSRHRISDMIPASLGEFQDAWDRYID